MMGSPGERRALDRVHADAPRADDDGAAARRELSRVENRADARDDAAGEKTRPVEPESAGTTTSCDWSTTTDSAKPPTRMPGADRPAGGGVEPVLGHQGELALAEIRGAGEAGDCRRRRCEGATRPRGRPAGRA